MPITVNLPLALEQQLRERAARIGQTLEEYLQWLAVREAEALASTAVGPTIAYPPGFASPEERSKALREWAESHPWVEHCVDDSRESIYAGRGE
jgi:hypothetical protein